MKHILITTIAAAVLVGCGETQQSSPPEAQPAEPASEAPVQLSSPPPEAKPVEPVEPIKPIKPVAKAAQPAQDAEAEKQEANRALMAATRDGDIEAIKQQLAAGADVNAIDDEGLTALDRFGDEETAALLYKHGAKRARDLKAEGK
ncbi:MAG: hypothetical protein QGF29_02870 [Verrucomicrobiota bacterium]|nr:hypothetical protein [Verrucomicrobiota bacterium]